MNSQSEAEKQDIKHTMEHEPMAKKKEKESNQVLKNQILAIQEYKNKKARRFYQDYVEVETIGGLPIRVLMWMTDEKASLKNTRKKKEVYVECDICTKSFDERRKLLIHMRCHKIKDEKIDINISEKDNPIL